MIPNAISSNVENLPPPESFTAEIERLQGRVITLSGTVDWWNTAIVVMMVIAAVAATGLVLTQYIAFRRAKDLNDIQFKLDRAKDGQLAIDLKNKDIEIGKAQRAASDANTKAESERLARTKLEEKIAPRRLNEAQSRDISDALKPFSGKRIVISSYAFDTDGIVLAEQIQAAVMHAGISVVNEIGAHIPAHAPIIEGVQVTGTNGRLVSELKKLMPNAGIGLSPDSFVPGPELLEFKNTPTDVLATIYVGAKPITGADASK